MNERASSWPVRIACVTVPPALALAAIVYVARYDAAATRQVAGTDTRHADENGTTASRTSDESNGDLPPGWFKPETRHEWEDAKSIDVATASRAVEAANDIYRQPQDLRFDLLEQLNPDVARILAKCHYCLAFPKLSRLSKETAAALANHRGGMSETGLNADLLELTGLQDLPADVAAALASRQSGALLLGSAFHPLPTLTAEAARELSRYQGRSMRICVKELTPSARNAIQAYSGQLQLEEFPRK
jgi:hypothetical protein